MNFPNTTENIMHLWFMHLFDNRKNNRNVVFCFECNKPLHEQHYKDNSTCYSHLLEKKKYPHLEGLEENVKIVCPDCHNLYTMKPQEAKKQYKEMLNLKSKYNIS